MNCQCQLPVHGEHDGECGDEGHKRAEDAGEALTPTFVQLKLDQQAELADAAIRESTAISDYNFAIARLEQAKGTLLRYNNILLEEGPAPTR